MIRNPKPFTTPGDVMTFTTNQQQGHNSCGATHRTARKHSILQTVTCENGGGSISSCCWMVGPDASPGSAAPNVNKCSWRCSEHLRYIAKVQIQTEKPLGRLRCFLNASIASKSCVQSSPQACTQCTVSDIAEREQWAAHV